MSHVLTETPTLGSSVTVPDGGDARTAASVETPLQACANRIKYCENHVVLLDARTTASYTATRMGFRPVVTDFTNWTVSPNGLQHNAATAATAHFMLDDLPHGSTLTQVHVSLLGFSHAGVLPTTKPTAKLYKRQFVAGFGSSVQISTTITDAPASAADFDVDHILGPSGGAGPTWSGLTEVIDSGWIYYVEVAGEAGAGSQTGLTFTGTLTRCTVTTQNVG